jgi:hypothetical protein
MQAGSAEAKTATTGVSQGFSRQISIGGARPHDNAVLLDGTSVKSYDQGVPAGVSGNFLGGEAIQEFKVERNSYSAQYGGSSGGVINVVSKAGTNDFHGSAYGFFRDDSLDAANFRAPTVTDAAGNVTKDKPDFQRQQYGASAGGRILRNRTFYFANYEGLREELGYTGFVQSFTAAARQGILPGRTIQVKPEVIPYLDLWPTPGPAAVDLGDGTAREAVAKTQPTDEDFFQVRVDHNISNSDAVYGRITRQVSEQVTPLDISRWSAAVRVYNTFLTVEERKIFSANLLNTFRFGFNRRGISQTSTEDPPVDPSLLLLPLDKWAPGSKPAMGRLAVTGVSQVGFERPEVDRATNHFQFINDLVYNRGAHSLKFGGSWLRTRMYGPNPSAPGGWAIFGSIDDFLRGRPRQFRGDFLPGTDAYRDIRWNLIGSYVQDDWQVSPRLTLNLGLRHEFYTVPVEVDGKFANLRDPLNDTEITVLGTQGDSWWENPSFKSFQPRMGLSWDPTGSGRTAVRAGGGIFYNHIQAEAFRQAAYRTAPYALETNYQAQPGQIPFPDLYDFIIDLGPGQAQIFLFPYENARNPHMVQWNLNVQHEVLPQTAVTVGYAGSRGLNLTNSINRNTARADLIDGRYVFPVGATRPNPAFNLDLESKENASDSWYHSLQLEMSRRFQAGWMLQMSYTYSKAIDEASQYQPTFSGDGGGVTYYWEPDLRRGLAAFHVTNKFSATGLWMLPFGNGQKFGAGWPGWVDKVFGGWQLGGQLTLSDGNPATIGMGARADLAAIGLGSDNPDLIPGGNPNPVLGDPDRYFDASQFAFPPARTIGNLGRNTLILPGLSTVDVGLTKNTNVSQEVRLQLRLELFNVLNRANLGSPSLSVFNAAGRPSGNAGFIGSTSTAARQVQLGMRLEW